MDERLNELVAALRNAGAVFGYLFDRVELLDDLERYTGSPASLLGE